MRSCAAQVPACHGASLAAVHSTWLLLYAAGKLYRINPPKDCREVPFEGTFARIGSCVLSVGMLCVLCVSVSVLCVECECVGC